MTCDHGLSQSQHFIPAQSQGIIIVDALEFLNKNEEDKSTQAISPDGTIKYKHVHDLSKPDNISPNTYLLLYLNEYTFAGDDHQRYELVQLLTSCLDNQKIHIVLAHERDKSKGGCSFDLFLNQVPIHLIDDIQYNLFKNIAVPLYSEQRNNYCDISLKMIASSFGATTKIAK